MKLIDKIHQILIGVLLFLGSSILASNDTICEAHFSYEVYQLLGKPSVIKFKNESSGNPTVIEWNFGDGSTSNQASPIHYFPENGDFMVSLSISNDTPSSDQTSQIVTINVPLNIDFNFKLDSNNIQANTYIFSSEIDGYYDYLLWNFGDQSIINVTDTTHTYPNQDTDYQVILTAKYYFNDTSVLSRSLAKGLTTSSYYNLGGQVYFGDSLMNNPYSTGDTGIAYLYRMNKNSLIPIDTNYFEELGYYWFAQKLKAYYVVKVSLTENSEHYHLFAPSYFGNTTNWDQAEIINLAQDKFREDVYMVEKDRRKSGTSQLQGSVFDLISYDEIDWKPIVCLNNTDEKLIDYQAPKSDGSYLFENLSAGHYLLSTDITGIRIRPQLLYIDGKGRSELKSSTITTMATLFPNPARDYSILQYQYEGENENVLLQYFMQDGRMIKEETHAVSRGNNIIHLDLKDVSKGNIYIRIRDKEIEPIKLLHY